MIFLENSAAALTAVELGYQLGSVFAPLLVSSFLDERFSGLYFSFNSPYGMQNEFFSGNSTSNDGSLLQPMIPFYPPEFIKAFWMLAGFGIFLCLVCLILHIHGVMTGMKIDKHQRVATKQTLRESLALRNYSPNHPYYALAMLLLLFVLVGCVLSVGRVYAKIIFSYTRDGPGFSVQNASLINSAFFIASTAGGLIYILPLLLIHVKYIIQVGYILNGVPLGFNAGIFNYEEVNARVTL